MDKASFSSAPELLLYIVTWCPQLLYTAVGLV